MAKEERLRVPRRTEDAAHLPGQPRCELRARGYVPYSSATEQKSAYVRLSKFGHVFEGVRYQFDSIGSELALASDVTRKLASAEHEPVLFTKYRSANPQFPADLAFYFGDLEGIHLTFRPYRPVFGAPATNPQPIDIGLDLVLRHPIVLRFAERGLPSVETEQGYPTRYWLPDSRKRGYELHVGQAEVDRRLQALGTTLNQVTHLQSLRYAERPASKFVRTSR